MNGLGELVQLPTVVEWQAQEIGDDIRRHLTGHVLHQITFASLAYRVDDLRGQLPHTRAHVADRTRDKIRDHQPTKGTVARRVHHQHHGVIAQIHHTIVGNHDGG